MMKESFGRETFMEKLQEGQWTRERAWQWHNSRAWVRGVNYLPSNCTRLYEMWQEYGFDERIKTMECEIALAEGVGFNSVRMVMSFEPWQADRDGYMDRLEQVLTLLNRHGFTMLAVFGNDCRAVPREEYVPPVLGPQKTDWGYHGGVKRPPSKPNAGEPYLPIDDPKLTPLYYEWVRDIIEAHKDDPRVIVWNLWNEPGNNGRGNRSEPYLREYFKIARKIAPIQPLTADSWQMTFNNDVEHPLANVTDIEFLAMDLSDIVSFHHYGKFEHVVSTLKAIRQRYDRPIYNTEWLHRIFDNNVGQVYPLFWLENVGSYQYGLVEGRAQYYEPWENLRGSGLPTDRWQHDLFRANHRPYSHKEIEIIKEFNALADASFNECT